MKNQAKKFNLPPFVTPAKHCSTSHTSYVCILWMDYWLALNNFIDCLAAIMADALSTNITFQTHLVLSLSLSLSYKSRNPLDALHSAEPHIKQYKNTHTHTIEPLQNCCKFLPLLLTETTQWWQLNAEIYQKNISIVWKKWAMDRDFDVIKGNRGRGVNNDNFSCVIERIWVHNFVKGKDAHRLCLNLSILGCIWGVRLFSEFRKVFQKLTSNYFY